MDITQQVVQTLIGCAEDVDESAGPGFQLRQELQCQL